MKFGSRSLVKYKLLRSPKLRPQRYLKNLNEPKDKVAHDSSKHDETVLVEDSLVMRQKFRNIAQRIRIIKVYGIKKSPKTNDGQ